MFQLPSQPYYWMYRKRSVVGSLVHELLLQGSPSELYHRNIHSYYSRYRPRRPNCRDESGAGLTLAQLADVLESMAGLLVMAGLCCLIETLSGRLSALHSYFTFVVGCPQ